jgi:hypothetical protein
MSAMRTWSCETAECFVVSLEALTKERFHKLYVVTSRILAMYRIGYLGEAFPGPDIREHHIYIGGRNGTPDRLSYALIRPRTRRSCRWRESSDHTLQWPGCSQKGKHCSLQSRRMS